jgi:hypothetical protein
MQPLNAQPVLRDYTREVVSVESVLSIVRAELERGLATSIKVMDDRGGSGAILVVVKYG